MFRLLTLPPTSWFYLPYYLGFWVFVTATVTSYGLGPLIWKNLAGGNTGWRFRGWGLLGGLVLGGGLTALAYAIAVQTIEPIVPDASIIVSGKKVFDAVMPIAIGATFVGTQLGIGLNVLARARLRREVKQRLSNRGRSLNTFSLSLWQYPSLVWTVLATLLWFVWFRFIFREPSNLWPYDDGLPYAPSQVEVLPGIVWVGAAIGVLVAILWQGAWQRPLLPTTATARQNLLPRLIGVGLGALVGGLLWWALYSAFVLAWIADVFTFTGLDKTQWVMGYWVLHGVVLGVTTGPLLGLVLQTQRGGRSPKILIGAAWGAIVLVGYRMFADAVFFSYYQSSPVPLALRWAIAITLMSGLLGCVGWLWYRQRSPLWLGCLGLGLAVLLGFGLSLGLLSSPFLRPSIDLWLSPALADDLIPRNRGAWIEFFPRLLPHLPRPLMWGLVSGAVIAALGTALPLRQAPPARENIPSLRERIVAGGRSLLHLWLHHPRMWRWLAVWSGGWLVALLAAGGWQDSLALLWPQPLPLYPGSLAETVWLALLGIFEVLAIATLFGAAVGLGWQHTRQQRLFEDMHPNPTAQSFGLGVGATALCGGWFGLGWVSLFLMGSLLRWFSLLEHPGIAWVAIVLYLPLHALLLGWATTLLGHAFGLTDTSDCIHILWKSAAFMAIAGLVWGLLAQQSTLHYTWMQESTFNTVAVKWRASQEEISVLLGLTVRGGLIGAAVGWLGYSWSRGLSQTPASNPAVSTTRPRPRSTPRPEPLSATLEIPPSTPPPTNQQSLPTDPLTLARQGDPTAIARLLNRQLQSRGIRARVLRQNAHLQIVLESNQPIPQANLTRFIQTGLMRLAPQGIEQVRLIGRQRDRNIVWQTQFPLS